MEFEYKKWTIFIVTGSDYYAVIKRPGAFIAEIIPYADVPRSTFAEGPMMCVQRAKKWIDGRTS
jgi:hypothetical protein